MIESHRYNQGLRLAARSMLKKKFERLSSGCKISWITLLGFPAARTPIFHLFTSVGAALGAGSHLVERAWPLREKFPDKATAVSCCGITDMNNTTIS